MDEGYLFDAGWLFFAAWSMVVLVVSWVAFRKDLISSPSAPPSHDRPSIQKHH
jgi:hypothetical protein